MKTASVLALVVSLLFVVAVLSYGGSALASPAQQSEQSQAAKIAVTEKGFEPSTIALKPNVQAKLTFVRQTDKTCATAVAIPQYKINRDLPLNEPVVVQFTPKKTGEFTFACGMDMLKGKLVVEEKGKERSMGMHRDMPACCKRMMRGSEDKHTGPDAERPPHEIDVPIKSGVGNSPIAARTREFSLLVILSALPLAPT